MKKALLIVFHAAVIALLFATPARADWTTAGALTNPAANTILADTGPAPSDLSVRGKVFIASTVAAVAVLEWRNAANTANVRDQIFPIAANAPLQIMLEFPLNLLANERLRIRLNAAITGSMQASLFSDLP